MDIPKVERGLYNTRIVVKPRLKEMMEYKKITQEQLSRKTGVSQGTISRFDRSRMHQDWILFALSAGLGCNVTDLFIVTEEEIKK